jgi:hypothetical protein
MAQPTITVQKDSLAVTATLGGVALDASQTKTMKLSRNVDGVSVEATVSFPGYTPVASD